MNGHFVERNRLQYRLSFKALQRYCVKYAPVHVYISVVNWLMPERVWEKRRAGHAYPVGGEYVVDVDANTVWRPHSHARAPVSEEDGYSQNRHHFVLSCDVMRIITFPGSLNGGTVLICSSLGGPGDFERMSVSDILWNSRAVRFLYDLDFTRISELHSHPRARAETSMGEAMTLPFFSRANL